MKRRLTPPPAPAAFTAKQAFSFMADDYVMVKLRGQERLCRVTPRLISTTQREVFDFSCKGRVIVDEADMRIATRREIKELMPSE